MAGAREIIALLGLERHLEGGWFRQTFTDAVPDGRAHSTAIYYLLEAGDESAWHRVDAAEVWHWYAGAALVLTLAREGKAPAPQVLGPHLLLGERPQVVVPRHCWQSAKSLGAWTLAGCTVAPGFTFSGFELAAQGWQPG